MKFPLFSRLASTPGCSLLLLVSLLSLLGHKSQAQTTPAAQKGQNWRANAPSKTAPVFDFSAVPFGRYSTKVNTPTYKEYDAYLHTRAKYGSDIDPDHLNAFQIFNGGQADFSVSLKTRDGQQFFNPQSYVWASDYATYVKVVPPDIPDENTAITIGREALEIDENLHSLLFPGLLLQKFWPADTPKWITFPTSVVNGFISPTAKDVVPEWWENMVWLHQLAMNAKYAPDEWRINTSTPTKTLFWDFGQNRKPPSTTVHVQVFKQPDPEENGFGQVAGGEIKINWHPPARTHFELAILPVEWQVNPNNLSDYIYTMFSSEALQGKVGQWAYFQIVAIGGAEVGGAVAGEVAPVIIDVVADRGISTEILTRKLGDLVQGIGPKLTEAEAETLAGKTGKLKVLGAEIGENGAIVETAVDSREVQVNPDRATPGESTVTQTSSPETMCRGGECFVAGTPVVLADGTVKPIELIKVGDEVLSRDFITGQTAVKRVSQTFIRHAKSTVVLHLADGQIIEATPDHPVFVGKPTHPDTYVMKPAGELGIGTSILTRAGPGLRLEQLDHLTGPKTVYNFSVEGFHTYFVGKSADHALWVHNATDNYNNDVPNFPAPTDPDVINEGDTGSGLSDQDEIKVSTAQANGESQQFTENFDGDDVSITTQNVNSSSDDLNYESEAWYESARPQAESIWRSIYDRWQINSLNDLYKSHSWSKKLQNFVARTIATSRLSSVADLPAGIDVPDFSATISGDIRQARQYSIDGQLKDFYNESDTDYMRDLNNTHNLGIEGDHWFHAEIKQVNQWAKWLADHPGINAKFELFIRNRYMCDECKKAIKAFVDSQADVEVTAVYYNGSRRNEVIFQTGRPIVTSP